MDPISLTFSRASESINLNALLAQKSVTEAWETSLHVFVDKAFWTISGTDDHGSHH